MVVAASPDKEYSVRFIPPLMKLLLDLTEVLVTKITSDEMLPKSVPWPVSTSGVKNGSFNGKQYIADPLGGIGGFANGVNGKAFSPKSRENMKKKSSVTQDRLFGAAHCGFRPRNPCMKKVNKS